MATEGFPARLRAGLAAREAADLLRRRVLQEGPCGRHALREGRHCLNFCSNDYLGMAAHPDVVQALRRGAAEWGVGSGASHLVCGHTRVHHQLEEELAAAVGRPRALLCGSGFQGNTAILGALLRPGDAVFQDRLNHASLIDGGLHSGARFRRYPHNDIAALARLLERTVTRSHRLVVTDAVFSMDGDQAQLPALAALCRQQGAWLMVDDAHGFGVLGERGAGSLQAQGVTDPVPVYLATLGKALGSHGAFVAGDADLVDYLVQYARPYVYSTALPPALAAATRVSLQRVRSEGWRRQHLQALMRRWQTGARQLGLPLMPSDTPIQPLWLGDPARALAWSRALLEQGFWVSAIRPPTVLAGTARLRVTLTAAHQEEDVDRLLSALAALQRRDPVAWPGPGTED